MEFELPTLLAGALLILCALSGTFVLLLANQLKNAREANQQLQTEMASVKKQFHSQDDVFRQLQSSRDMHRSAEGDLLIKLQELEARSELEKQQAAKQYQQVTHSRDELAQEYHRLKQETQQIIEKHRRLLQHSRELTEQNATLIEQRATDRADERLRIFAALNEVLQRLEGTPANAPLQLRSA